MLNSATLYHTILDKKEVALDMISTALEFAKTDLDQVSRVNAKQTTRLVKVLTAYKIRLEDEMRGEAKALVIGSPENGKLPTHRPNLLKAASPLMSPVISDDTKAQRQRSDSTVSEKE
ncbi:hypothetical protein X801_04539 [Opisthorchis viverrini]|uniref:Uncharacterized protein n=1 Tax=Opisthorchis viverrini TaxID=6198 RepID=A0A1S8WYT9_OPIVI|nr:hypothetical protein X801_04539 [Opisthorchis viverrini]